MNLVTQVVRRPDPLFYVLAAIVPLVVLALYSISLVGSAPGIIPVVLLAGMASTVILLQHVRQSAIRKQRLRSMSRLDEAAITVHSLRYQAALDQLAATALDLVGADFSGLTVLQAGSGHAIESMAYDAPADLWSETLAELAELVSQPVRNAHPVPLEDTGRSHFRTRTGQRPGVGPLLSVPLPAGTEVLGRLMVARRPGARPFDEVDAGLLRQLAQHAVTAVQRRRQDDERKALENQLREKNQNLDHAIRLKAEFLANMSHELRTPLSAIIGFSDLLIEGPDELTDDQAEDVGQIQRAGRVLLDLINDILDLSKIESGRMTLEMADNDLTLVIGDVLGDHRPLADARGIQLVSDHPRDLSRIQSDQIRVRQVLTNLVSNAIKFTAQGSVTVRCQDLGGDMIEISVIDTGIGIKADALEYIFDEFTQADTGTTRKFGGTGLGLAISRRLIELQGGEIGVESSEGQGSRFWFRLPRATEFQDEEPETIEVRFMPGEDANLDAVPAKPLGTLDASAVAG